MQGKAYLTVFKARGKHYAMVGIDSPPEVLLTGEEMIVFTISHEGPIETLVNDLLGHAKNEARRLNIPHVINLD